MASFLCVDVMCYNVRYSLTKNACIHLSHILFQNRFLHPCRLELPQNCEIWLFSYAANGMPEHVWCVEALGFVVAIQPAVVAIRCRTLLAAPCIFFRRGVDSIPWGPLCFRCMELWEAVLFPCLAPYWGKGL